MIKRFFSSVIPSPVILVILLSVVSCKQDQLGPTIVAGELPGLGDQEIKTWVGGKEVMVETDADGKFLMELDLKWDHYLWFQGLDQNLYLVPGDSIFIDIDKSGSLPYRFIGGESGLISTWYAIKDVKLGTLLDTVDIERYYSQDATSYKELNGWIISEFFDMLDLFHAENPGISESFIALEKSNISHYWYYELNVYHLENYGRTGIEPDLPADFYDYLESVHLNDTLLYQYDGYRYFLYSWMDLQTEMQDQGLKGTAKADQIFDIAEETFTDPAILANVSWEILRNQNNWMNVDEDIIIRAGKNGVAEDKLENARQYMKRLEVFAPGNPAPDFELLDVNGKIATLNDFKGKYLLIDVWSHTCGPCIREIPRLEEIEHEFKGRNIEVITVCMSNEEPWRNIMAELGLPEKGQYRLENGWNSPFNNNYLKGSGTPTYIILDPDGKFAKARAPLPSQGLREVLDDLPI